MPISFFVSFFVDMSNFITQAKDGEIFEVILLLVCIEIFLLVARVKSGIIGTMLYITRERTNDMSDMTTCNARGFIVNYGNCSEPAISLVRRTSPTNNDNRYIDTVAAGTI